MQLSVSSGSGRRAGGAGFLEHWFPVPNVLYPRTAGVDISDASIKWIALGSPGDDERVASLGEIQLAEGVVTNGIVQNASALSQALAEIKKKLGNITCAHAALPEEVGYVFSMHVPSASHRDDIVSMVEFELEARVPIPVEEAVYDFDTIVKYDGDAGEEIGVSAFPKKIAEGYVAAFHAAGFNLLSLEIEARSIARAVSRGTEEESVVLLADFGRMRTGFAVLKHGIPIFTSTVPVGGTTATRTLSEKMSLSFEDAENLKNEQGLLTGKGDTSLAAELLLNMASALADEVVHHYRFWDTRRNEHGERVTPVSYVLLVGGSANLKGLPTYIAGRVQAPAVRPNVWQNVCSFDDYIPPIERRASLQYATAIGLALRGV